VHVGKLLSFNRFVNFGRLAAAAGAIALPTPDNRYQGRGGRIRGKKGLRLERKRRESYRRTDKG